MFIMCILYELISMEYIMYRIIIPIVILLFITGCEKTIEFEKLQERDGVYYEVNVDKPFSGKVIGTHGNGQIALNSTFEDGELFGKRITWYENGQKKSEGNFKRGKGDGLWTYWYENGQKEREGKVKEAKEDGLWTHWDENGNITVTETYINGKLVE